MLPENYDGQRNRQTSFHSAGSGGSMQAMIQRLRRELEQTRQTLDSLRASQSPPMTYAARPASLPSQRGDGDDPNRTALADPNRTPLAQPRSPPPQHKDSFIHHIQTALMILVLGSGVHSPRVGLSSTKPQVCWVYRYDRIHDYHLKMYRRMSQFGVRTCELWCCYS